MSPEGLLSRIALAFGIGLLMGLERGWSAREVQPGHRAAGVRTFAISGLLGGVIGALVTIPARELTLAGALLVAVSFSAFAAVITIFSRDESRAAGTHSATTTIAALLTFVLGVYAVLGDVHIAAGCAVAAAGILALREGIHGWVARIARVELQSGLALLAMTFIALPIVPDGSLGPFGGANLREVWIIAIALASVSFAGYIAMKYLGERRGVIVSACIGGLVSSTAVAFTHARRAANGEGAASVLAAGTALAMAVSFVRVTVIVALLSPTLMISVGLPLSVAAVASVLYAVVALYGRRHVHNAAPVSFRNPFEFWSVMAIAISMGVLIIVGGFINERFGAAGTIAGAATMGLFDVDAMSVAMTRLVPDPLGTRSATMAILAGVASNTFTKIGLAAVIGRGRFAIDIALAGALCVTAGGLTMVAAWGFLAL